jgi:addiction module RelE/StbE family toxin
MENARFRIEFIDEEVIYQLGRLPKSIQILLKRAIKERLEMDPMSFGKPLQYNLKGCRRIRISAYRIIYKVNEKQKLVTVIAIDHRKSVYE